MLFFFKIFSAFELDGHFGTVNQVVFHPFKDELYSCGNDQSIYRWTDQKSIQIENQINRKVVVENLVIEEEDDWSDD